MHERQDTDATPADIARGHESRDISTRVVVIFGVSLVVGAAAVYLAIWLLFVYFGRVADRAYPREYPMARVGAPAQPPAPRLQTEPREELKQLRAEEDRILNSYGWVDANSGVAHIPIEQAMRMTLDQGLPTRGDAAASPVGTAAQPASVRVQAPSGRRP